MRESKVITVVGARPQFIKAAMVSRELRKAGVREVLVHTGQHYDANMSGVFFEELSIPHPDFHLGVGGGSHGAQTGQMLERIEAVASEAKPDWMLIYGDTNSTLAGALAAAKLHIPVAHVEAGLRSYNRRMPEEVNRVLADHVSTLLFAPTPAAVENLLREGISGPGVHLVGDVMQDAAIIYGEQAEASSQILRSLGISPKGYFLATIHRAENTDDPGRLSAILGGLSLASREHPVILPLHPRTRKMIGAFGFQKAIEDGNVRVIEPLGYLDMLMLERNARCIATDSGGVQKEAYFSRVPCVTLRDETEWVELMDHGFNQLVSPASGETAISECIRAAEARPWNHVELYGGGKASARVADCLRPGSGRE